MRLNTLLFASLSFCTFAFAASASDSPAEPEVYVVASFPEDNAFGHVVNGERNWIDLTVENKFDRDITLVGIGGSFLHPDSNTLIQNTSPTKINVPLGSGKKVKLPYTFYSEFKPGDLRLHIWLEHSVDNAKYRVTAYESIVTIVEPEGSFFDLKMLTTYAIIAASAGVLVYFVYTSYMPKSKRRRANNTPRAPGDAAASTSTTAVSGQTYQEEWIPVHHLPKAKAKGGKLGKGHTSGEETSGSETIKKTDQKRTRVKK